jgi:hypothetical protein
MWSYNSSAQTVSTTDLGTVDFNWVVLGSDPGGFTPSLPFAQMLMDYVPSGTMTVWWVRFGQLTGINLGQRWINVGFVATGDVDRAIATGFAHPDDFLVSNLTDHHLYDWWIDSNNTLQGIDLGSHWSNVSVVATGIFTRNGGTNLLVSNTVDHHLYDWWISGNTLQGIDLGPYWDNVSLVGTGQFPTNGSVIHLLVANTVDHHLYDWWIGSNNTLQGVDLGPVWSNVQLVAVDRFDNNNFSNVEMLVQNTVDHHLYEWWITSQGHLAGIDLGPYWANIQLIGHAHYNNNSPAAELLVRNTVDGHFYEWWIANNQLQGVDLGPVAGTSAGATAAAAGGDPSSVVAAGPAPPTTSAATTSGNGTMSAAAPTSPAEPTTPTGSTLSDSSSLLVQAMSSFAVSDAIVNSASALVGAGPVQQPEIATPTDPRFAHTA